MKRTELKILPDRRSNEPKRCLVFRYRQGPATLSDIPEAVVLGIQVLTRIAVELRRNHYEVSEPSTGKKSFGITWMKCRAGTEELGISAWPPEDGDEWQIRTRWSRRAKPLHEITQSELVAWDAIRSILNDVVATLEGARDLRWLSLQEAEDALGSAQLRKQISSRHG